MFMDSAFYRDAYGEENCRLVSIRMVWDIQSDSKVLSGFQFIDHVKPDNNLESLCICMEIANGDFIKFSRICEKIEFSVLVSKIETVKYQGELQHRTLVKVYAY
jgi:hypothetical protein